jgi:ethanolamine permease
MRCVNQVYQATSIDVWALGITVVIGGQYLSWNFGLVAGFGSFFLATMLIGSAYIGLIFSLAEISSALPFAGGSYALARCMVGFYPGFIIGCCESLEYIVYVATSAVLLANMCIDFLKLDEFMNPIICLAFYLSAVSIHIYGRSLFWSINMLLAVVSLLVLLVYCFGNFQYVDLSHYGEKHTGHHSSNAWFVGGFLSFAKVFPLSTWFYVGVESLGFANDMVLEPKIHVPRGFVSCVLTLFVTSILVFFSCAASAPGIDGLMDMVYPLNPGFKRLFGISSHVTEMICLPAIYATAFGFIYGYGKILNAMAMSKLLPSFLSYTMPSSNAPYAAIIFGSVIGYSICLVAYFHPLINLYLFNICIFNGFMTYITQCIGYIRLKNKLASLSPTFISPFGIYGAIYAACIFSFGLITVIGFQEDDGITIIVMAGVIAALSVYYFLYAMKHQQFSDDELKLTFNDLVAKYNRKMLHKIKHGKPSSLPSSRRKSLARIPFPNKLVPIDEKLATPNVLPSGQQTPIDIAQHEQSVSEKDSSKKSGRMGKVMSYLLGRSAKLVSPDTTTPPVQVTLEIVARRLVTSSHHSVNRQKPYISDVEAFESSILSHRGRHDIAHSTLPEKYEVV